MNANQYLEESARTCARIDTMTLNERQIDLMHAAMGMVTEAAELCEIELKKTLGGIEDWEPHFTEELGDYLWYIALYMRTVGIKFEDLGYGAEVVPRAASLHLHVTFLAERAAATLDFMKKNLMYGKPVDEAAMTKAVEQQYMCILDMTGHKTTCTLTTSMFEIMEKNIAKLRARYPDKFTREAAIHRDLDAEQVAMG